MCRKRCILAFAAITCVLASAPFADEVLAQRPDDTVDQRLRSLEGVVSKLEKQVSELNRLLRAALPPSPVVQVEPISLNIAMVATRGSATAKIALIEYSDFECPFCGQHAKTTYPQLQKQYVETGRIKYVFKHLPLEQLHPSARKAAAAGECAGEQGKFWEFHDRLFANQKALTANDLGNHARDEQLDLSKFTACLDTGRVNERIARDLAEAGRLGLTGTPAFLMGEIQNDGSVRVSHKLVGALPLQVFQESLDSLLAATTVK